MTRNQFAYLLIVVVGFQLGINYLFTRSETDPGFSGLENKTTIKPHNQINTYSKEQPRQTDKSNLNLLPVAGMQVSTALQDSKDSNLLSMPQRHVQVIKQFDTDRNRLAFESSIATIDGAIGVGEWQAQHNHELAIHVHDLTDEQMHVISEKIVNAMQDGSLAVSRIPVMF